ncbi:galanin receptor type 1b [Platichthys flesus]|uniref:galanin receptor type 1b n=1 Tax=Platichthys flesus TaxID=8260 RepID=UPI002DBC115F|nr:galanin receptor type 1b [Platichthys flesus]
MLLLGNASSGLDWVLGMNQSEVQDLGSSPEAVMVPLVFGLIFVVGLVGNSLVILVICGVRCSGAGGGGGRRTESTTNIFILNLSVADLLFLLFCVPLQATVYSLPQWVFGSFLCSFGHFFFTVSMLVSIFTLVAMSVDRYIAVVRSNQSPCVRSRRNALVGACVIWTLSVACAVPVAQHQTLTTHTSAPNSTFCWEQWSGASRRAYRVSILLLGYLLPLLLISCCYTRVLIHLYNKMKNMSQRSERVKRKTTQIVLLVISAFTICWMPHHIIAMWVEFGTFPLNDASFAFRIVSHCLSYGNSCINPVLYAFLSENFRKSCRKVFTSHFLCPPAPQGKVVRVPMENFSSTTHVGMSVIR